jgi:hypothetical protein
MATSHTDNNVYDEAKKSYELQRNTSYGEVKPRRSVTTKEGKTSDKKVVVVLFMAVTALLICTVGVCIAFTLKIVELQSETAKLGQDFASLKSEQEGNSAIRFQQCEVLHQNLRQESAQNISDTVALYQNLSQDFSSLKIEQSEAIDATEQAIEMIYYNISQGYSSLKINIDILQEQTNQTIYL